MEGNTPPPADSKGRRPASKPNGKRRRAASSSTEEAAAKPSKKPKAAAVNPPPLPPLERPRREPRVPERDYYPADLEAQHKEAQRLQAARRAEKTQRQGRATSSTASDTVSPSTPHATQPVDAAPAVGPTQAVPALGAQQPLTPAFAASFDFLPPPPPTDQPPRPIGNKPMAVSPGHPQPFIAAGERRVADERRAAAALGAERALQRAEQERLERERRLEHERVAEQQRVAEQEQQRRRAEDERRAAAALAAEQLRAEQERRAAAAVAAERALRLAEQARLVAEEDLRRAEQDLRRADDERHERENRALEEDRAFAAAAAAAEPRRVDDAQSQLQEQLAARVRRLRAQELDIQPPSTHALASLPPVEDHPVVDGDDAQADGAASSTRAQTFAARDPEPLPPQLAADPGAAPVPTHMPFIVFLSAGGRLPDPFCHTELFISTYRNGACLPDVSRIVRAALRLPSPFSSARSLIKHIFDTCPSSNVYTGASLPLKNYRWSTAVPRRLSPSTCRRLAECLAPRQWLDQLRDPLAAVAGSHARIKVVHLYIEHFMLRDLPPSLVETPADDNWRSTPPLSSRALPTFTTTPGGRLHYDPDATRVHDGPSASTSTTTGPAQPAASRSPFQLTPHDLDANFPPAELVPAQTVRLLRTRYADQFAEVFLCQLLSHPNTRAAAIARMPHQERFYGKAFAAYRIWLLMEEVWLSMGLSTDSPSTLQPCSFPSAPGNSHSLSPNLVALAFGVPPATLAAYKTRFRAAAVASDGVASALRNPVLDVLARATLTALAHNISWFCPEKRHRKPMHAPADFPDEKAVWEWSTADLVRELGPWVSVKIARR